MNKWEQLLVVGAEGGSLTLYGMHNGKCWQFSTEVNDQTPSFIDEPDIFKTSNVVFYWEEAVELLGKYPWHRLYPVEVHPAFRGTVLAEVVSRLKMEGDLESPSLSAWLYVCGQVPN